MRLAIAASLCLTLCGACQTQGAALRTIPERWHGEWSDDLSACGENLSDSAVTLSARRMEFVESHGEVRGVFTNSPFEIVVVADMVGEGLMWLEATKFRMAPSGESIAMDLGDDAPFIRYRCPSPPGPRK